jgi:hypothetical protein
MDLKKKAINYSKSSGASSRIGTSFRCGQHLCHAVGRKSDAQRCQEKGGRSRYLLDGAARRWNILYKTEAKGVVGGLCQFHLRWPNPYLPVVFLNVNVHSSKPCS